MRFAHIKRSDGGVTSFGYQWDKDTGMVVFQRADCCPSDQFSRPKARLICTGRMNKYGPRGMFSVTTPAAIYPHLQTLITTVNN